MVKTPCFQRRGAQVRSLVGELRSHMPHGVDKKLKKLKKKDLIKNPEREEELDSGAERGSEAGIDLSPDH